MVYSSSVSVAENVAHIREAIAAAARRAQRQPEEIALMAVTKTFPPERIREAYEAGLRLFGENRVQEFAGKASALADLRDADWHMIGHLQTNKAGKAAELFAAVDSVDSLRLAQKINDSAQELGKKLNVLIEINVGGEEAKTGIVPESSELEEILRAAPRLEHLVFRGLMTIPPFTDGSARCTAIFSQAAGSTRPACGKTTARYPDGRALHGHVARLRSRHRRGFDLCARWNRHFWRENESLTIRHRANLRSLVFGFLCVPSCPLWSMGFE